MTCKDCRFSNDPRLARFEYDSTIECRKLPPAQGEWKFPRVETTDWCGAFEPRDQTKAIK